MKFFLDSADPVEIQTALQWGVIDGVTTNPTLVAKVGRPYADIVRDILSVMTDGPVNLEIIATEFEAIVEQAHRLAALSRNVVVKIPCTPDGIRAVKQLHYEGIKTNVTLVFSPAQALVIAKVGADYCSPFLGRLDDVSTHSGDEVMQEIRVIYTNYQFSTKILAASIRDVAHLLTVARMGVEVATVPFLVLQNLVSHPLTERGLAQFLQDWNTAGLQFPA